MPKHWQQPPIFELLLRLQLFTKHEHKKELEQKLLAAKRLLESYTQKLNKR